MRLLPSVLDLGIRTRLGATSRGGRCAYRLRRTPVCLALLALATTAEAWQAGPSPVSTLFAPNDRVPLSEFKLKNGNSVVLHVEPGILAWVSAHSGVLKVAVRKLNGQVVFQDPTNVNSTTGEVTLNTPLILGDCVVVTTLLRQALPIATHWNASLNYDPLQGLNRGGWQLGATNGILSIEVDMAEGDLDLTGSIDSTDDGWDDPLHPEAGPYTFKSNTYALFDDGSGQHVDAPVPAYERYIAENFDLGAPTNLSAIWLSDRSRAETGYPIAHKNHPEAFDTGAPVGKRLEDDLPVFQMAHARIIQIPDQSPVGNEHSLATFVLPPGWTSQAAANTYPLLFNGQHDLHIWGAFDWDRPDGRPGWGKIVVTTLAELHDHPGGARLAVANFWNGGGTAAITSHASAYDNAAQLIADAATLLKADPERIVFTGGSRGGITALEMASNPYDKPYTAKFVNSYAAAVRMGSTIQYSNPSYPGGLQSTPPIVGWKNSWMESWTEPYTGYTGLQMTMLNLYGTIDPAEIDTQFSADSVLFRNRLFAEGTRVVIRYGTHDLFHSYEQMAHYYDRLVKKGIPVQMDVFYRFGHQIPRDALPTDADLMNKVFDADTTLATAVKHYGRTDPVQWREYEQIHPPAGHMPLVFETPIIVGTDQTHTWSFVGQPGGAFELRSAYMGPSWNYTDPPPLPGAFVTRLTGTLAGTPNVTNPAFGTFSILQDLSASAGFYWYEVLYSPDGDTNYEVVLGKENPAAPGTYLGVAPPTVYDQRPLVLLTPFHVDGDDDNSRTGGLSEDDQFP